MSDEENKPAEGDEDNAENFDEDEGGGGFNAKKILLFVLLPLFLLGGAGAGLYFSGLLDGLLGGGAEEEEHADGEHAAEEDGHGDEGGHAKAESSDHGGGGGGGGGHGEGGSGVFLEIPTMLVNLNTEGGTPRYLRLTVQLEMNSAGDVAAVEAVIPRVVDQFQTYLRELRVRDLRGSAGIYRLQMELLWRVNQAAAPIEVKDVLFQEILIQ